MLKVVVVDTGIDRNYVSKHIIGGVSISEEDNQFWTNEQFDDCIGHGTGTTDVILRNTNNVEIYEVKVFDEDIYITCEKLCYALEYIDTNLEYDLIQVSLGITAYSKRMHDIIQKIVCGKQKCVISAFDNEGAISYPAAFEEVIGVDINYGYSKKEEFDIIEGNIIDIRGGDSFYRMASLEGKSNITKGTSFLTSYFTALIANMRISNYNKETIMEELKKMATRVYKSNPVMPITAYEFTKKIRKAIIFPFNKEIHSIAAFEDMLSFEVAEYYDIKHKFLIGKQICDILKYTSNTKEIKNYDNIDWTLDFDTVICGHVGEISKILRRNFISEILYNCIKYNKKVFFFDDLRNVFLDYQNTERVFCPYIEENKEIDNRFGKLRLVDKPVLAVMGTSSKQGKFTIQLSLLREIKKRGYKIDGIGSEPSSTFFGYSQIFPFGYGVKHVLSGRMMIKMLNEMIWNIEKENVDLILTGSQSGTISYDIRNEELLTVEQYNYLLGTNPDGVVLCVNEIDELDYIARTIGFIESIGMAKVIALVMSETHTLFSQSVFENKNMQGSKLTEKELFERFKLPIFLLSELDIIRLADVVLEYYGQ